MTKKELATLARIVNEIRHLSDNAPTQDGRDESRATVDCIAYSIAYELIPDKNPEDRKQFKIDTKLV